MAITEEPEAALDAPQEDESEAVARAKRRDSATWAAWHDAYYPLLYRYAYVRLYSAEEAEDLASQVFLEALKSIDRFKYTGRPVLAWLYGIANHLVQKRRRKLAQAPVPLDSDIESVASEEDSNLGRVMAWAALEKLKEEHREVLILRYLLDIPSAEVARLIGKTEAATYSLQVRALEAARRVLTQPGIGGARQEDADKRRSA
jgi:RNA polymerase sigma-70 factor (ECF subfamily)